MKKNASLGFAVFLILLYSAIQVVLLIHHEPWEDEAQAWLIARDLDIVSIFKQMAYEGSPALWHMLLLPFAKTGLSYISEFILHLIIAVAAVTVFVLYAPFSRVTKVLFIFSYYMAYEYSIIARSYGLSILFLFLIAALYIKRFEHPLWFSFLVFLLFNTNVHSFFIACSLTILFAWELHRKKVQRGRGKVAVLIMFTGGLLCFLQLLSPPDNINYGIFQEFTPYVPFVAIAHAFFPYHSATFMPSELRIVFIVISFLMFSTIILSLSRKPAALFILLLSFAGLSYVFAFKHPGAVRHHGLLLIIVFFTIWISKYYDDSQKKLFDIASNLNLPKLSIVIINVCLALSLFYSLKIQYLEYEYPFSGAKEIADFIKKNHLDNYTIVAHQSFGAKANALLPYLPGKQFWYVGIEDYGTFIIHDKKYLVGRAKTNEQA
ncbi:MAG: hypothetical protein A2W22_02530, partial [Candidatus Levybacteria bacterium RBG_16_35_11]